LAVFTAFNILANYKFPLNEALYYSNECCGMSKREVLGRIVLLVFAIGAGFAAVNMFTSPVNQILQGISMAFLSVFFLCSQTNINAYISINGSASNKKLNLLERSCLLMFGVFGILAYTLVL